jgi:hypothetical protein
MSYSVTRFTVGVLCILALHGTAASAKQTSTRTEKRAFEVVDLNGNALAVREASGAKAYMIPETFRFTVDRKSLSIHELQPGMKGVATFPTSAASAQPTSPATQTASTGDSGTDRPNGNSLLWVIVGVGAVVGFAFFVWQQRGTTV